MKRTGPFEYYDFAQCTLFLSFHSWNKNLLFCNCGLFVIQAITATEITKFFAYHIFPFYYIAFL